MTLDHRMTAILPCNDLDAAEAFFARLGLVRAAADRPPEGQPDDYRILSDGKGGHLHLNPAVEGWVVADRNPFGLYLYVEDVDSVAARFAGEIIEREGPSHKPWGMYEFALNGPDDVLVRVGWPSRLMEGG